MECPRQSCCRFFLTNSPTAARRAAQVVVDAANLIAENLGIGAPRAEFREWAARFGRSSYVIRSWQACRRR
ncbi:hypothetical protein EGT86_35345 [Burkholderia pseudomallei]|nr:hypothetical protein CXQ84_27770 [Burkholderia pseudomallei]AYE32779.1 hypothetical protein CNX72_29900 [Burkholderia pseudomallei]PJO54930.1 hypothetical protein CWD85_35295 [Burkholderia pseudomallei]RPA01720.1 hypothetical protein EGT86_35345 [Burkholderia pseudomallei]